MSTSSLLRLEHVQKNYGKTEALSGVNLDIQPGRIVGLLGPNGSGKTTIIKLINGLLQPTSGQVLINGEKPSPKTKKAVSYLPDTTHLGDHMKIIEYDMDDTETLTEVKAAYDEVINSIIDFNQDDYGFGPFLVLEGYYAQLGVSDVDDYLENLIAAIKGEELNEPGEIDTYYYLRDGKVKEE